jgi:hypothetical protein
VVGHARGKPVSAGSFPLAVQRETLAHEGEIWKKEEWKRKEREREREGERGRGRVGRKSRAENRTGWQKKRKKKERRIVEEREKK